VQFIYARALTSVYESRQSGADFPFKHLTRGYLVRGLSSTERAASFAHHYRRMNAIFPSSILRKILYKDFTLLKKQVNDHLYSVRFGLARKEVREGELALALVVDGVTVYILQFTIVPGWVVKSSAADVLLVSRLQGVKGATVRFVWPPRHSSTSLHQLFFSRRFMASPRFAP
jgi:uncharacterized protein VirK/YbjX